MAEGVFSKKSPVEGLPGVTLKNFLGALVGVKEKENRTDEQNELIHNMCLGLVTPITGIISLLMLNENTLNLEVINCFCLKIKSRVYGGASAKLLYPAYLELKSTLEALEPLCTVLESRGSSMSGFVFPSAPRDNPFTFSKKQERTDFEDLRRLQKDSIAAHYETPDIEDYEEPESPYEIPDTPVGARVNPLFGLGDEEDKEEELDLDESLFENEETAALKQLDDAVEMNIPTNGRETRINLEDQSVPIFDKTRKPREGPGPDTIGKKRAMFKDLEKKLVKRREEIEGIDPNLLVVDASAMDSDHEPDDESHEIQGPTSHMSDENNESAEEEVPLSPMQVTRRAQELAQENIAKRKAAKAKQIREKAHSTIRARRIEREKNKSASQESLKPHPPEKEKPIPDKPARPKTRPKTKTDKVEPKDKPKKPGKQTPKKKEEKEEVLNLNSPTGDDDDQLFFKTERRTEIIPEELPKKGAVGNLKAKFNRKTTK